MGHPVGLYVLVATEVWERFSYYGMRALLILYLTKVIFSREMWQARTRSAHIPNRRCLETCAPICAGPDVTVTPANFHARAAHLARRTSPG